MASLIRPKFRQHGIRVSNNRPFCEMNITPLIDVLLVLLVMMMLSIPIALHEVEVDLPPAGTGAGDPVINTLRLNAAGATIWNGKRLGDAELQKALRAMAKDPTKPQLHIQTDATARYERFDQVIAMVKRSRVREIGFVGNERFVHWDRSE